MARRISNRPSSISMLPDEAVDPVNQGFQRKKMTIDQAVEFLRSQGYEVSRSAVGRHKKSIEEIGERLRTSREIARAIADTRTGDDEVRTSDLVQELLHDLVFRAVSAEADGVPVMYQPKEIMMLAAAQSSISTSKKTDADRRRKDREEAKKEFLEAVAKASKTKGSGLTKAIIDEIYHAVLGVEA